MKIKAMFAGVGAALVLAVGLAGLSGTASAAPKEPTVVPSAAPAEERPTAQPTAAPHEPAVVKPAYTG
ncbi:MAG: hypothetical protein HOY71_53425 [Nonomuraea sp.]|nr:hypothetical protein [Nonomuraea sp.]